MKPRTVNQSMPM